MAIEKATHLSIIETARDLARNSEEAKLERELGDVLKVMHRLANLIKSDPTNKGLTTHFKNFEEKLKFLKARLEHLKHAEISREDDLTHWLEKAVDSAEEVLKTSQEVHEKAKELQIHKARLRTS